MEIVPLDQYPDAEESGVDLFPQISLDELEFLFENHGISISDILEIPGFENFRITDNSTFSYYPQIYQHPKILQ